MKKYDLTLNISLTCTYKGIDGKNTSEAEINAINKFKQETGLEVDDDECFACNFKLVKEGE